MLLYKDLVLLHCEAQCFQEVKLGHLDYSLSKAEGLVTSKTKPNIDTVALLCFLCIVATTTNE